MDMEYIFEGESINLEGCPPEIAYTYTLLVELQQAQAALNRKLSVNAAASASLNQKVIEYIKTLDVEEEEEKPKPKPTRKPRAKRTIKKKA